ncbi:hypothetical protein K438DRAFT_1771416 [Mycena galopus ATCC 62051]|nr:hypothetical protein K438DRAFT_1771416 [Mycena galopus ATCC 62051]
MAVTFRYKKNSQNSKTVVIAPTDKKKHWVKLPRLKSLKSVEVDLRLTWRSPEVIQMTRLDSVQVDGPKSTWRPQVASRGNTINHQYESNAEDLELSMKTSKFQEMGPKSAQTYVLSYEDPQNLACILLIPVVLQRPTVFFQRGSGIPTLLIYLITLPFLVFRQEIWITVLLGKAVYTISPAEPPASDSATCAMNFAPVPRLNPEEPYALTNRVTYSSTPQF